MSEKHPADSAGIAGGSGADHRPVESHSQATTTEKFRPPRLPGIDGRSARAQRFRRTWLDLAHAIGREPSPIDRALLTDAALLVLEVESLAARTVAGGDGRPDSDELVRLSGALSRALERLGLTSPPEPPPVDPAEHAKKIRNPDFWRNRK